MDFLNPGRPLTADSEPTGDTDVSVDDEQLAVIPRHETKPSAKAERAEYSDLDSRAAQARKELSRRAARSNPVDEQTNADSALGGAQQRLRHLFTHLVRPEDVHLERHAVFRAVDEVNHFRESGGSVVQEHDGIAAGDVGSSDAPKSAGKRRAWDSRQIAAPADGKLTDRIAHASVDVFTKRAV